MYLGIYRFRGNPDELLPAYDRLMAEVGGDAIHLHACAVEEDGITIYDACPTREAFESFSASAEFRAAAGIAGLPEPSVEGVPLHAARARGGLVLD
jgi:hypothetical protein